MTWQEALIAVAQGAFVVMLLPAVLSKVEKPPRSTCIGTAFGCWAVAGALASLGMAWAATTAACCAACWTIMAGQERKKPQHTWATFLESRCDVIDWMFELGKSDAHIVVVLSMTERQVNSIRNRKR